jgi:hypothetical protein
MITCELFGHAHFPRWQCSFLYSALSQAIKDDVGSIHGKVDKLAEGITQLQNSQLSGLF